MGMSLWIDWKIKSTKITVVIAVAIFGMILELVQGYVLSYRTFEAFDLLADFIGIITFLATGKTVKKIVVRSGIFIN